MSDRFVLGVDIGGTGMKAAVIDTDSGELETARKRFKTPRPASPELMEGVFDTLVDHFAWSGPVGCAFPGVVLGGAKIATAANLEKSWIGLDAAKLFGKHCAGGVTLVNDADAAGMAEMRFGAGRDVRGVVLMITIGTGLGTALFHNGALLPNTELGHIEIDGRDAEVKAAGRTIESEGISLKKWASRFDRYLHRIEDLLWPDLFILGGGLSKQFEDFGPLLSCRTPAVPAQLRNHAGVVGAAVVALQADS